MNKWEAQDKIDNNYFQVDENTTKEQVAYRNFMLFHDVDFKSERQIYLPGDTYFVREDDYDVVVCECCEGEGEFDIDDNVEWGGDGYFTCPICGGWGEYIAVLPISKIVYQLKLPLDSI